MPNKDSDWYKYEELAKIIYSKLEPNSRVVHNDKIMGHLTKRPRQIDVSIRTEVGGHEILVIIEAKDRERAPDVMLIDGFAQKMRDVSASRGVIICRKKPNVENIKYASKFGIDICTAVDVNDHKWNEQILIPLLVQSKEFEVVPRITIKMAGDMYFEVPNKWFLSADNGTSKERIGDFILNNLNNSDIQNGVWNVNFNKAYKVCVGGSNWHPIEISLQVKFTLRNLFRFCLPSEYKALINYSNNKIQIADLKLEIPDLNDTSKWKDYSEFKVENPVSFVFADLNVYNFGLYGKG